MDNFNTNEKILSLQDKLRLKNLGIMPQKQEDFFSVKFLSKVGIFDVDEVNKILHIAKKYGDGRINLTSRLAIEISYINYKNLTAVLDYIKTNDLKIGINENSVRPIISCKGDICLNGLIDTKKLALKVEEMFLNKKKLLSKFKISISGCANGYGKAQTNDIGIVPIQEFEIIKNKCVHCCVCEVNCKDNALIINKEEKVINLDENKCCYCGKCIKLCKVNAIKAKEIKFLIFIGGRLGRRSNLGKALKRKFKENEIIHIINKIIDCFNENAKKNERFASVIERIGFEYIENKIIKDITC